MPAPVYHYKRGDRKPYLRATLLDASGAPIDLSGVGTTVTLRYGSPNTANWYVRPGVNIISPATSGVVEYQWAAQDLNLPGDYAGEWVVSVGGVQTTVPADGYFELVILGVGAFGVITGDTLTYWLLRRLRTRLADEDRVQYPDDNRLVQRLIDSLSKLNAVLRTKLVAPLNLIGDVTDPLATDEALSRDQQEVWALVAALQFVDQETLGAARIAAQINTPAGMQDMRWVYTALLKMRDLMQAELESYVGPDLTALVFVDTSGLDNVRLIPDLVSGKVFIS